jgi:hypothetical protein
MPDLPATVENLNRAQLNFLKSADAISASDWNTQPALHCWSAAQVVAHLCQVERTILGSADRIIRHHPRRIPFFRRWHFPLILVKRTIIRLKSPLPIDLDLLDDKETMLADLRGVRERTLSFLQETHDRELGAYFWPHPFLGNLNFYNWFTMICAHQIRHTKQMVDIAKNIPKRVVPSHK